MTFVNSFVFPNIPPSLSELLLKDSKTLIIIGVIGKSSNADCNKMAGLQLLRTYPSLATTTTSEEEKITFYYEKDSTALYIHFETSYDTHIMYDMLEKWHENDSGHMIEFNSYLRTRFAKMLLFAIQTCHLIVLVETGNTFDASYLSLFKSLKLIREKYVLKFLPKFLKNSNVGSFMGKEGRLCSPRFIFFFEKCINKDDQNEEYLDKIEFEVEDDIYKMLRNEFIITNNSSMSLFSIPRNKRFVYFNTNKKIRADPLIDSIRYLTEFIEKTPKKNFDDDEDEENDELDNFRPFKGFARPWNLDKKIDKHFEKKPERSILKLLKEHVSEALEYGFDDSMSKFRGKSHFVTPNMKAWYDSFKILHKLFIENPDNPNFEANDVDYKAYLENFHQMIDIDEKFFYECCEYGLECGVISYNELLPHHYNNVVHEQKLLQSVEVFQKYARGPSKNLFEKKLRETCDKIWKSGKQQCEYPSLRGNSCIMLKHTANDPAEHSSGVVYVSTCNCGRTQGHREDPYTIRQANYEFYQIIAKSCTACNKLEKVTFTVFQPSINDFKAAPMTFEKSMQMQELAHPSSWNTPPARSSGYLISQTSQQVDSSDSMNYSYLECLETMMKIKTNDNNEDASQENHDIYDDDEDDEDDDEDDSSFNEIVIKVGGEPSNIKDKMMIRQPSTTEYLPGMVHTLSPAGLLPLFPSWSLVCIGPSSVYSHSTGLPEHIQSGFLTGANFLLPWDVQVRLEHAAEWAASYEKSRNRKKSSKCSLLSNQQNSDSVFSLKIFVGNEYECPRGHRFILCTPDKILRGGAGIVRDSGSKVVFNDMPLYFACPCRSINQTVAQLKRIHVVTPKAPVNVILDPKIRTGTKNSITFVTGLPEPAKLSQSAYWILRLPYVYQGDDGPILPPVEVASPPGTQYGYLQSGMFGISETEAI